MGWSIGFDDNWKRDIGYGVPATCDHPGCGARIDRGLSYVCGNEPYGGELGCGLYFCAHHLENDLCERCRWGDVPFDPTPDVPEWIEHKETHESWAAWRAERDAEAASARRSATGSTVGDSSTEDSGQME